MTAAAEPILASWVAANPDAAAEWATAPEGWPVVYLKPLAANP